MYKKIFIITTEPSGDDLGYLLLKNLKVNFPKAKIYGLGGQKMESLKFSSIYPISNLSVNGIIEVLKKIFFFKKKINIIISEIINYDPDLIISIDSPSFCFRVIKKIQALRSNCKFVHLVTPTVWAWKRYRAKNFALNYDLLLSLYKFEPKYFTKFNKKVYFIGHPLFFKQKYFKNNFKRKTICLLPGSRVNEVKYILPELLKATKYITLKKNYKLKIITLNNLLPIIKKMTQGFEIEIVSDNREKELLLNQTDLAIVASGTAVLELASKNIPMVVVYKSHIITSLIVKALVKLRWANIVNILFNKEVIPELLFSDCSGKKISELTNKIINNESFVKHQMKYFKKLESLMLNKKQNPMDLAVKHIENLVGKKIN